MPAMFMAMGSLHKIGLIVAYVPSNLHAHVLCTVQDAREGCYARPQPAQGGCSCIPLHAPAEVQAAAAKLPDAPLPQLRQRRWGSVLILPLSPILLHACSLLTRPLHPLLPHGYASEHVSEEQPRATAPGSASVRACMSDGFRFALCGLLSRCAAGAGAERRVCVSPDESNATTATLPGMASDTDDDAASQSGEHHYERDLSGDPELQFLQVRTAS